jgi:lysozyme
MIRMSPAGLEFVKRWEGCKLSPYKCSAGVPTIGYGTTHYEDGTPVQMTDAPISQERADELLLFECNKKAYSVGRLLSGTAVLTQNQIDALLSFTYNVGVNAFASSTILRTINESGFGPAGVGMDMFTRWNKVHDPVTGELHPVPGLTNRRLAEFGLYST